MSEPLPGMPEPPEPLLRKAVPAKPGVRVSRIRPVRLCEVCCREIDVLGVMVAPFPRPARWRVVDGEVVQRLCEGHKAALCDGG